MILTNQLNPTEDQRAAEFLENYRGRYDVEPSYFANMFAGSCHVADSYLDVIRYGWERISEDQRKDPDKRETRREFLLQLIAAHYNSRELVRHFRF